MIKAEDITLDLTFNEQYKNWEGPVLANGQEINSVRFKQQKIKRGPRAGKMFWTFKLGYNPEMVEESGDKMYFGGAGNIWDNGEYRNITCDKFTLPVPTDVGIFVLKFPVSGLITQNQSGLESCEVTLNDWKLDNLDPSSPYYYEPQLVADGNLPLEDEQSVQEEEQGPDRLPF